MREVLEGIAAAQAAGFPRIKINTVVIRGYNDDEVIDLLEFARRTDLEIRFIEYMDVGGATGWSMDQVVSQREILDMIGRRYGRITPLGPGDCGAGRALRAAGWHDFRCDRLHDSAVLPYLRPSRLTADGTWLLCLYGESGLDLRELLRLGATNDEIARPDHGSLARTHRSGRRGPRWLSRPRYTLSN